MKDETPPNRTAIETITQVTREISRARLESHSGIPNLRLVEVDSDAIVLGHWMALILAAGKDIRVIFKTHFMGHHAQHFARNSFLDESLTAGLLLDFFKEFCNLTIGGLKGFLEANQVFVGTSLPVVTRGFDELFFPVLVGDSTHSDRWAISAGDHFVNCSAAIELLSPIQVTITDDFDPSSAADVEFF
ncbi:MAG: hypothetical protein AB7G93_06825 [Bdellovibrionales bacterium]